MTATDAPALPWFAYRERGAEIEAEEREYERMTEDEEDLADFRDLHDPRPADRRTTPYPEFRAIAITDHFHECAAPHCRRLLLAPGTTNGRRKGTVPAEATRISNRPYCPSCVRRLGASV